MTNGVRVHRVIRTLVLAALAACGSDESLVPTARSVSISFAVTSTPGTLPAALELSVRNAGRRAVRLEGCPDVPTFQVELRRGKVWEQAGGSVNGICPANLLSISRDLQPGETITRSVALARSGTYRAVVYLSDALGGTQAALPSSPTTVP